MTTTTGLIYTPLHGIKSQMLLSQILSPSSEGISGMKLESIKGEIIYIGDSPNDSPMFSYFPNSIGVANVLKFKGRIKSEPTWVTRQEGGFGFAEMVDQLLR